MQEQIKKWIRDSLKIEGYFVVEHPSVKNYGDYSTNVALVEAKKSAKNPKELAEEYLKTLEENKISEIGKMEIAGPGFINFFLKPETFAKIISDSLGQGNNFGKNEKLKGQKIIIEHTQPNPFKEFHIGHLMNNTVGETISRILKFNGAEIKTATYHGDKGLHVAKAVWAVLKHNISFSEAYAYGHKMYEEDENAKNEIIGVNKKIYDGNDEEVNKIYKEGWDKSFSYFESLYQKLGSHFDFHFYESESGIKGTKIVRNNVGKIFEESEGAVIFRGENFEPKTHTRVFINKEGLPTYEAKEVGLAELKLEKFGHYDKSITITANEQDSFFDVVEVAIGEIFPDLKGKLLHLSHGILKLSTGKMSSRTGSIISAEGLINQVKEKILDKIKDRGFDEDKQNKISEMVAIGAIKYMILKQSIGGDIIFDFDKSISFEGDSGPYLQYATVRGNSVLKKASEMKIKISTKMPENWQTVELEKLIEKFEGVILRAEEEYAPHYIVTYLIDLAGEFNSFYAKHKIIDKNDVTSPYKLALTQSFVNIISSGLNLLGISVPEEM